VTFVVDSLWPLIYKVIMGLTDNDLDRIGGVVDSKLQPLKRDVRKIKKDVSVVLDFLDRKDVELERRLSKVEIELGLNVYG
jgi:hypothetical protein